jgi:hypothetical protein
MWKHTLAVMALAFAACGGDDDGEPPPDPVTVTITGTAVTIGVGGSTPEAGVLVEAFDNADDSTAVANATTDASGNYSITVTTDGGPLDGFLKATKTDLVDTYLYPPEPLVANFDGASINMVDQGTFDALSNFCGGDQDPTKGTIAMLVQDAAGMEVAGATISTSPAGTKVCYNGDNGLPDSSATVTEADGLGYVFNVTGSVTVSATADGLTIPSHVVTARPAALTTTLVQP